MAISTLQCESAWPMLQQEQTGAESAEWHRPRASGRFLCRQRDACEPRLSSALSQQEMIVDPDDFEEDVLEF
jgi:hypothetical protein